jgi:hypothetical protein
MKTMNKIFGLFVSSMVVLSFNACGGDDGPTAVPKSEIITHDFTLPIQGIANQEQREIKTTLTLSDAVGKDVADNLISTEFQRGDSPLKIDGLKAVTSTGKIQNLKIKVGSKEFTLGTCTANPGANEFQTDVKLGDDKYTEVSKYVLEGLTSAKKVDVYLTFTPTVTLTSESSPVNLIITVTGNYKYNTYPSSN